MTNEIHKTYLPFTEESLKKHFVNSEKKHCKKYKDAIDKYSNVDHKETSTITNSKIPCQVEKDETVWTASVFTQLFEHKKTLKKHLIELLKNGFGEKPPLDNFQSWEQCLETNKKESLHVFFEAVLPAPEAYKKYLRGNLDLLIPYVKKSSVKKDGEIKENLEGPTHVDALLLNTENGFAVLFEAKVLSDISYQTTYNEKRNQIIRNIDVMLEKPKDNLNTKKKGNDLLLLERKPENTLFCLLTPEKFKNETDNYSRLYGYKYHDYKKSSIAIKKDLPHRDKSTVPKNICNRIGWITWEDFKDLSNKEIQYCKWIDIINIKK